MTDQGGGGWQARSDAVPNEPASKATDRQLPRVILGYGDLFLSGDFDPLTAKQMDGMEALVRRARDLSALINATLDFSRSEAGHTAICVQEIDVHRLLADLRAGADGLVKPESAFAGLLTTSRAPRYAPEKMALLGTKGNNPYWRKPTRSPK
ncbi:hypothetical protein L6Q96_10385 [Candidatus Binatia bacterium]|nr:hypothetical protein [Candidatus Binatia bacterium]